MTSVLFVIGLVVAALGIPGALDWLQAKVNWQRKAIDEPLDDYMGSLPRIKDPRALVPPPSPSGVVRPRPSVVLAVPSLGELREAAQAELETPLGNQSTTALWANVNAARVAAAAAKDREPPPPPQPRPRWD